MRHSPSEQCAEGGEDEGDDESESDESDVEEEHWEVSGLLIKRRRREDRRDESVVTCLWSCFNKILSCCRCLPCSSLLRVDASAPLDFGTVGEGR